MREVVELGLASLLPATARWLCVRRGLDLSLVNDSSCGFDAAYYGRLAGREFTRAETALLHYLARGVRRTLRPRADFDPAAYGRRNPDVELAGYEPFTHYLHFGRLEGRGLADDAPCEPAVPELSRIAQCRAAVTDAARVNVVIPVYGNRALTLRAIHSVLAASVETPFDLVVVDDASPDPLLRRDLALLAEKGLFRLLVNERNLGFVASVNRAFRLDEGRDVVLLNSDTRVFGNWLDRLLRTLHRANSTGTVSPMSNAATILSYPMFLRDNHPAGMDGAQLDRLAMQLDFAPVELPTAVGFCMAIKRACLDQVGPFDAEAFGSGYGEENDFSRRALARGWRHHAATNVFVWHRGGGSFGAERDARIEAAQQTLERLHPGYAAAVQRFIRADPLRPVREALDAMRIRADPRRKVMWMGARRPAPDDDVLHLELRPETAPFEGRYRIVAPAIGPVPNLPRIRLRAAALSRIVKSCGVAEVRMEQGRAVALARRLAMP
jgi:GT2 family glycosyltransferase